MFTFTKNKHTERMRTIYFTKGPQIQVFAI